MENYDYIKGYRGFRFEKHLAIDDSQPILSSYRSAREKSSIADISSKQRVGAPQCELWLRNLTHSLSKRKRLGAAVAPILVEERGCFRAPSERSGGIKTDFMAISPAPFQLQRKRCFRMYEEIKPIQAKYFNDSYHGSRSHKTIKDRCSNLKTSDYSCEQKGLSKCLIIHNGIERTPRCIKQNRFFAKGKKEI